MADQAKKTPEKKTPEKKTPEKKTPEKKTPEKKVASPAKPKAAAAKPQESPKAKAAAPAKPKSVKETPKPKAKAPAKPKAAAVKRKAPSSGGKSDPSKKGKGKPPAKKAKTSKPGAQKLKGALKKKAPKRSLASGKVRYRKNKSAKKPLFTVKPIGGEKNGGTRVVRTKRRPSTYRLGDYKPKRGYGKPYDEHKRYSRKSLTPGTICILVAGPHKGKRVVLLKHLKSGLLLVTGPYRLNGCPLRRVNKIYVVATSTKISLEGYKLPKHLNDKYFKRKKQKRTKKEDGDIFQDKSEGYKPSDKRKKDQGEVDKKVLEAIGKTTEKGLLKRYLSSNFYLRSRQFPHKMKF